ncbi:LuxR C-terminal-related transcriptional regulator [Arsenophonus nasoniae]|uniref:Bacterial regulatory protein, luxR family n=1 Tax=Arsenophonus nasoniae TaxID=638 RepID=D2U3J7_9GAMM|nr:PAS and helix-turn-helix domain-containing protein [Arsenophonus nasoniae]QBY45586.1 Bacterial regulatory protein, luxR family [Arsenophonus nasoniae]WGL95542.1 LuxR C-terminal-related transcriptional regulator [Arsenophonus nasoniae]WGM01447.1 LuxR C-terminal-related transcriptional regulator [Arsenophonus nasoniae]WGM05704.1 LuxR C-terminal-related transcriptional regulator [Arsenophonus nasoniae]WGM10715.1 LuxR C-terminal-related transcriptional regulator [Arsenophonus nasoniae]
MGKTISDKNLGSLYSFLKHEKDPWGIKDLNSRYVYVNNFSHLGIKLDFNIEGILDSELPHPVAELSSDLIIHDNNVIFNDKKEAVIQTSFNFKEKRLKPYFFEKRPFYNESGEIIGTIYHGRELANLCINIAHPSVYLFTPPNDLFSNRELDIVFLAQQKLNSKEIAKYLNIAIQTVEVHLKSIYKKVDVHCLRQFIEYCKSTGFDRYIPQKFLKNEIKFVK